MADDAPKLKSRTPDYEGYTRGVKRDVSKRQQGRKSYAKAGADRKLDFTTSYRDARSAPGWILSEKRSGESPESTLKRYNKFAESNRSGWQKEYKARDAYDKGEGGIRHYDTKPASRSKRRGGRRQ